MKRTTIMRQEREKAQLKAELQEQQPAEGASGCLFRVYWMLLGNALVFVCAYRIVEAEGALILADAFYWLAVAGLVGARYVDVRYMEGRTAEGQPATMRDWRRYRLGVLGTSAVVWAAAHALGYLTR